jgi:hypothetical protein
MVLAVVEPSEASARDAIALGERARQVASQISQLDGELIDIVQQLGKCTTGLIDMTVRQYVGWQAGLTPAEASQLCRLADRLESLPQLTAELRAGRLSAGTTATLATVATPHNEAALIETATVATGAQLQTLVRAYKQNTGTESDAERPPPTDSVSYGVRDGRWRLRAEKEAAIADAGDHNDGEGMLSNEVEVSNAVAFVSMARSVLAGKVRRDGILPERFQIILHVEDDHGAAAQGGGHVDRPTVTEFLCESWITVVTKRRGQPATITSPTRLATPAQQRALLARDRTCRFPGCGRSFYLKAHHITYYENGGPTQLDNLVLLCQMHHTLVHKPGWRVRRDANGMLWFTGPDGRVVLPARRPTPQRPPPPRARPHASYDRLTAWASTVILDAWLN